MVRMSGPCSGRRAAKACLTNGMRVMGWEILQIRWTFWHSGSPAALLMCWLGISPEESQRRGLSARHQSRKISKSFGESIT
jgi:hypothetical protein